jgi:hypothetical protein
MDVKRFSSIVFLLLVGALFLWGIHFSEQNSCIAAVVWIDNFSDGDINDWTVELGTFSVADETLRGVGATNAIRHASATASGTWTFDIEIVGMGSVYVSFLAGETSGGIATSCYCLRINRFDMQLLQSTNYQNTLLDEYDPTESIEGWVHIEITRTAVGQCSISVNGTEQITANDATHGTSNFFVFYCNVDCAIDNIEIDDAAGTTTTTNGTETPVPPGIPGFPLAAIGLGLLIPIALVLVNRRRNAGTTE